MRSLKKQSTHCSECGVEFDGTNKFYKRALCIPCGTISQKKYSQNKRKPKEEHRHVKYNEFKADKERGKKISISNKGISKAHKGKLFTEEHKAKIKAKRGHLLGRKNTWQIKSVLQYDKQGNFIKEWESQAVAQSYFNKPKSDGIGAVCRGDQKTAYGFIWKFK